ncbi:hypothetical protein FB45DRAFT_874967 [Roridomyces roridus]|uniref:Uncharacterized protein n=1 Tax=Roridomyces roridus TaxID=1738132 RepID=A0AAD7FDS7_9AGAR|nr:hypothetical protein FB45DRAFT_874967 [Roridomyces roridus]
MPQSAVDLHVRPEIPERSIGVLQPACRDSLALMPVTPVVGILRHVELLILVRSSLFSARLLWHPACTDKSRWLDIQAGNTRHDYMSPYQLEALLGLIRWAGAGRGRSDEVGTSWSRIACLTDMDASMGAGEEQQRYGRGVERVHDEMGRACVMGQWRGGCGYVTHGEGHWGVSRLAPTGGLGRGAGKAWEGGRGGKWVQRRRGDGTGRGVGRAGLGGAR